MPIAYYALHQNELGWQQGEAPVGIIVVERQPSENWESLEYHAMHWDHDQKGWVYDPARAAEVLGDIDEYGERIRNIVREEAERVTPGITGGEGLPDEDTIRWIFQWKGAPPQAEDTGY